jgi:hypothetical protein
MLDLILAVGFWGSFYGGALALTEKYVTVPRKREDDKYVPLESDKQRFFKQNLVSLYYALVCVILEVIIIYFYGAAVHRQSYWLERIFFCHTFGFFLYDLIAKIKYRILNTFVLVHHIIGGAFCIYSLVNDYVCSLTAVGLFLFEVTHPFLVLKEALEFINYPQTSRLYMVNLWTFCFAFMICRGLAFYATYLGVVNVNVSLGFTLFTVPNLALTCIWILQMVSKLWKTLPFWYKNPKEVENATWWINARESIRKYTRQKPHTYVVEGAIYLSVLVFPITYAYCIRM